jgi:hypothetical protein
MRYLIILLLIWSAVSDFFASKFSALGNIDELIVLVLVVHLLIDAIVSAPKRKGKPLRFSIIDLLIVSVLAWTIGSFIVNRSSIVQLLLFLFSVSKGFIVFYWIRKFLKDDRLFNDIIKVIKWLILIQVPFFVVGLALKGGGYFGDNAVGAFITGDTSSVATFFWFGIIICLARYEQVKNPRYLLYSLGLLGLLIVTSTKQLTLLLPVVLVVLYWKKVRVVKLKQAAFVVVGLVAALGLYTVVENRWMQNFNVDASESSLLDYMNESEKILGYYSLLYELPDEIAHPITWGAGPGMYGTYVAMNARAPLSQKYIMYYFDLIPDGLGGSLAYRSSSIIGFWGDIGLIGLLLIVAVYVYQTFNISGRLKGLTLRPLHHLVIACGLLLVAQSFILNVFEGNSFALNLFWILCGVGGMHSRNNKRDTQKAL